MSEDEINQTPMDYSDINRAKFKEDQAERGSWKQEDVIEKDFIPHFLPTFRISRKFYAIPIIAVVILAGVLAYLTYVVAGVDYIEGGYVSEEEFGLWGAFLNGIIFTVMAAVTSFIIIFLVKKFGINVLKYLFGGTLGFVGYFMTLFFSEIGLYLVFIQFPETEEIVQLYYALDVVLMITIGALIVFLIFKYFTTTSIKTKNFFVFYISLLIGAIMGIMMPLWTTTFILIGFSLWDIFAVKSKRGPIKEMIDLFSESESAEEISEDEIQERIARGEAIYDTEHLEIGIGDLAFYSMLTSAALIQSGNIIVMFLTAIAVIVGTGITISFLKRNKILPGLPISIFLGLATMFISGFIILTYF